MTQHRRSSSCRDEDRPRRSVYFNMMRHSKALALATVLVSTSLVGCADFEAGDAAPEAPAAASPTPTQASEDGYRAKGSGAESENEESVVGRKLIRTAELHVEVESYEKARRELDRELAAIGGFVAGADVAHQDGSVSRATLTLRVPADKLDAFLATTADAGKVLHEQIHAEDITDGYTDLEARLANARRLEGRFLAILDEQARGMKELLEVERELARVREEIERFEGKKRMWDKQVAMSTVNLSLFTRHVYVAQAPDTLGTKLEKTLGGSFTVLVKLGQGLLLAAIALVPWLLPFALVAFALRALYRRIMRREREAAAARAATFAQPHGAAPVAPSDAPAQSFS
ncbi:MAG: DUF4349 domain-containing protein [Polyangiaceae bacterium]